MTTKWVHITNGVVDRRPAPLPANWKTPDAPTDRSETVSAERLKAAGWLPAEVATVVFDPKTHVIGSHTEDIQEDKVVYTPVVRALTARELAEQALHERRLVIGPMTVEIADLIAEIALQIDETALSAGARATLTKIRGA